MKANIIVYMHPANMTPQHYADDLVTKSRKLVDVYDEGAQNDIVVEGVDSMTCHCLRHYWCQKSEADLTEAAFQEESLLCLLKKAGFTSTTNQNTFI